MIVDLLLDNLHDHLVRHLLQQAELGHPGDGEVEAHDDVLTLARV